METGQAERKPISVYCVDTLTDEVIAGIRVYAALAQQVVSDQDLRHRWLRWNVENPYGPGVFVVAKDGPAVVGMYAVIPVRMRVAGQLIQGGKGEYQAVLPGYLRAIDAETGVYLPTAMCQRAFAEAAKQGIRAIQAIPTEVARFSVFRAGARPVMIPGVNYLAFLRWCNLPRSGKGRVNPRILSLAGLLATSGLRTISIFSRRTGLAGAVSGEPPQALDPPSGTNQFLAEEMLLFRFPASDYESVTLNSPQGKAQFIFTKPHRNSIVRLSHWSPYFLTKAQWTAGLDAVFCVARAARAGAINVKLPRSARVDPSVFRSLGFFGRPYEDAMFVYSAEPELADAMIKGPWTPTHSHIGLYTYS